MAISLALSSGGVSAHSDRSDGTLTISGRVLNTSGAAVGGATLVVNNVRAYANAGGDYTVTAPSAARALAVIWAPNYSERIETLDFNGMTGSVNFNFSGNSALSPANINSEYGARLLGLPVQLHGGTVTFHVTSSTPLSGKFGVTFPNGFVKVYPLVASGSGFSGTFPVPQTGAYRVEIVSSGLLPVFNVLAFHGSAATLPNVSTNAPDPPGASTSTLAATGLRLVNTFRKSMGLSALAAKGRVRTAAQRHTEEMVKYGYFLIHPHIGLNGSTPGKRVVAAGFHAKVVGEDIGSGPSMAGILLAWLDSPLHRFNLLTKYRWAGMGVVRSGGEVYATLDFAR